MLADPLHPFHLRCEMTEFTQTIACSAPCADHITPYDQQHFITYARLLDADAAQADWHEVARIVLLQNPDSDPEQARLCWQTHLDRAKWVATTGYQQLIAEAEIMTSSQ